MLRSDRQLCESFSSFSHDNATTVLLCFLIPYVWPSSFLHSEREKGKKRGLECSKNKGCNFAAGFTSEQERKRVGGKKPKLSTTNWDHQTDGWPFWAKLCICLGISPESNSVQTLQRPSFGWGYKPKVLLRAYTHAKSMALYSNTRESGLAAWWRLHLQPQNERCQLIKEHMSPGEITGEHFQSLQ